MPEDVTTREFDWKALCISLEGDALYEKYPVYDFDGRVFQDNTEEGLYGE